MQFIGKKSKAAKGKTSFKVTKNTSLFESESSNTAASSIASDSGNNKYVSRTQGHKYEFVNYDILCEFSRNTVYSYPKLVLEIGYWYKIIRVSEVF